MHKIKYLVGFVTLALAIQVHAFDTWHTVSGKSYDVYGSQRLKMKSHVEYMLNYSTERKVKDKKGLNKEFNDLLTHLYYFKIPKKDLKNSKSFIIINAFHATAIAGSDELPSTRHEQKLSKLAEIAKSYKGVDKNRLKAFQAFNKKQWLQAANHFKKIEKSVPHDYQQTANAYLLLQKKEKAVRELELGLKKYSKNVSLLNNLAMTKMLTGTFVFEGKHEFDPELMAESKKLLTQADAIDPKNWLTKSNLAVIETTFENYAAAERLYQKALDLSDGSSEAHYQIANFFHERKKWKKAREHYEKAQQLLKYDRMPATVNRWKKISKQLKLVKQKKTP